jgi:hypothetical protein
MFFIPSIGAPHSFNSIRIMAARKFWELKPAGPVCEVRIEDAGVGEGPSDANSGKSMRDIEGLCGMALRAESP